VLTEDEFWASVMVRAGPAPRRVLSEGTCGAGVVARADGRRVLDECHGAC